MADINWAVPARLCQRADDRASAPARGRPIATGTLGAMICEAMSRPPDVQKDLVIECGDPVRFIPYPLIRTLWRRPDCPIEL